MLFQIQRLVQPTIVAAMTVVPVCALATNGYFSHGIGIKNEATAGAGIALPQDTLAAAVNPAGLVDVPDGLDFGLTLFRPSRGATITQGSVATDYSGNGRKNFVIPSFGYAHKLNDRVTLAIAVYGNGGLDTDYTSNPFARFGATGEAGVDLSAGLRLSHPRAAHRREPVAGHQRQSCLPALQGPGAGHLRKFSRRIRRMSATRGYDDSIGFGVRIGWQAHVTDQLTLGATWQSRTQAGRFKKYAGLFADQGGFDIPSSWGPGRGVQA